MILLRIACQPAWGSLKVSKEMEITGPHAASWTCNWQRQCSCEIMDRNPYRSDLGPRDFHIFVPLRSTWLGNTRQREASCHLLGTCTWHSFLLRQDKNLGVTVGQMVRCRWLICEVWYVPSANNVSVHTEVWCMPYATNIYGTHKSENTVIGIGVFNLFFETFLFNSARILQLSVSCSKAEIKQLYIKV